MTTDSILRLEDVAFGWDPDTTIIDIQTFAVARGESVFLRGPSGSGKSTLLGLIGGVLVPTRGRILIQNEDLAGSSAARRDRLRADVMGIIFQQFNLLPYLGVLDNVTLPCHFSAARRERSRAAFATPADEARTLIARLGLPANTVDTPVNKLSVGQQQRVAVARALIGSPGLIIADEPTSALDASNRDRFIELLNEQRRDSGASLLFVSHDPALATHFDRVAELGDINAAADAALADA